MRSCLAVLALLVLAGCECGGDARDAREREPARRGGSAGGDEAESASRGRAGLMRPPGPDVPAERFELVEPELAAGSTRARGWASLDDLRTGRGAARLSLGNWLCRLWTHYGPPPQVQRDGFVYVLRDRDTGAIVSAYSAGSGPALGGRLLDEQGAPIDGAEERVAASVNALVAVLEATEPRPCALELETDFGRIRVGVRDGEWFEEELE